MIANTSLVYRIAGIAGLIFLVMQPIQFTLGQQTQDADKQAAQDAPESPMGNLGFITLHTDGEKIQWVRNVPAGGKTVEQTYTVMVPVKKADGTTEMRAETRTRQVGAHRRVLAPIPADCEFETLAGTKIEHKDILQRVPMAGMQVIMLYGKTKLPTGASNLLKDDTVILRRPLPNRE